MEINRLVTAELGMQVRVSLTGKWLFASVPYILGVFASDTTTYSFLEGGASKLPKAIIPNEAL